jgi:sec-independent protein translocase protein TatB
VFDIGWSELLLIALAFLVFLGPKELPRMMQKVGRLARSLSDASRELRNQLDAELKDVPKPRDIADELSKEAEAIAAGPYAEIREMDEQLKRDLAAADPNAPRFEPAKALPEKAEPAAKDGHVG